MNEELKEFDISVDDIKLSEDFFDNLSEAIKKMRLVTFKNDFEVVLNNNLIEFKEIKTQFKTILGCRISYKNLNRNISFIVREDIKPSYEELEQQFNKFEKENEQLKQEKQEVIDYVNHRDFIDWHIGVDEGLYRRKDILNILKGDE